MGDTAFACVSESSSCQYCACVCMCADCCFLSVNMTKKTLSVELQEEGVMVYRVLPAAEASFPCVSTSPHPES